MRAIIPLKHLSRGLVTEILVRRKIGLGDQNFRNISPGGPFFPENFGPPVKKKIGPTLLCA